MRRIWLNHSKGNFKGEKGQVWLIFTYLSILISSIEVLPKCIASCSFSEVIRVLFSNCNDVLLILNAIFKVRKVLFGPFDLFRPLSVYVVTNVCMKHIYTKSYMIFQFTL